MRVLIVAATTMEIAPILAAFSEAPAHSLQMRSFSYAGRDVDVLVTGVGMVATAAWCAHVLAQASYDFALDVGVCGSFDPALTPGTVVHVTSDRIAELGAEDGDQFLPIDEMKLPCEYEFVNEAPLVNAALERLPAVSGITVNTVHGNAASIAAVTGRFAPQVESMEGAAFMYACRIQDVPFAQVRAVSNIVEPRNPAAWKMAEAIERLGQVTLDILNQS
jgi:futalosine hydrolase